MAPKIIKGIVGNEIDAIHADDLVTGEQASVIGGTTVLHVIDGDARARRVEHGIPGTVEANLHGLASLADGHRTSRRGRKEK